MQGTRKGLTVLQVKVTGVWTRVSLTPRVQRMKELPREEEEKEGLGTESVATGTSGTTDSVPSGGRTKSHRIRHTPQLQRNCYLDSISKSQDPG